MKLKNVLLSLTASAMLVAPVAAQAGTTAAASTGKIASLKGFGDRKSAGVAKKNKADGTLIAVAAAAVVAGGIIIAVDGDDNKSKGS